MADVGEKIARFRELIKRGYTVKQAMKESGLSRSEYERFYDEIWSDPELESLRSKLRGKSKTSHVKTATEPYTPKELEEIHREVKEYEEKFNEMRLRVAQAVKKLLSMLPEERMEEAMEAIEELVEAATELEKEYVVSSLLSEIEELLLDADIVAYGVDSVLNDLRKIMEKLEFGDLTRERRPGKAR